MIGSVDTVLDKPTVKPENPRFASGPCTKRPGWDSTALAGYTPGRYHRSTYGKSKLASVIEQSRDVLRLPSDWRLGIVPASDTGAVEMALWSLLGARGVDVLAWESFGKGWLGDIENHLGLSDVRAFEADYGDLPDLGQIDCDRDVVFAWNGTTSGVRVPNGEWISDTRKGLTICDATSAAFAVDLPWPKLDVVTYSWQKVMGGEGAHGMLILSPRAVERLESYTPPWPLPKIFRLTKDGKLNEDIFRGATINTPSMLAVEDSLDGLEWARSVGGLDGLIARCDANAGVLGAWVARTPWIDYLARDPETRSNTSVCLSVVESRFTAMPVDEQRAAIKKVVSLLDEEGAAYDVGAYRAAPPGLRIWTGATVETADLEALLPWLDWAFSTILD
jgi:phosphoserine aminotransferase